MRLDLDVSGGDRVAGIASATTFAKTVRRFPLYSGRSKIDYDSYWQSLPSFHHDPPLLRFNISLPHRPFLLF